MYILEMKIIHKVVQNLEKEEKVEGLALPNLKLTIKTNQEHVTSKKELTIRSMEKNKDSRNRATHV